MRELICLLAIGVVSLFAVAQEPEKILLSTKDPFNLYATNDKDSTTLFYYKLVPKNTPIAALVILPGSGERLDDVMKQITLHKLALEKEHSSYSAVCELGNK